MQKPLLYVNQVDAQELFALVASENFETCFELSLLKAGDSMPEKGYLLFRDENNFWSLDVLEESSWKILTVDFSKGLWAERIRKTWNTREVLRDALRFKKGEFLHVVDATAGLCGDTLMMAVWGHFVMAFEQNPVIYVLAHDALERLKKISNLDLKVELKLDSFFARPYTQKSVDRVYLDPLYPPRPKDALNRKELRMLHGLASGQEQRAVSDLLQTAQSWEPESIVLKRPQWALEESFDGYRVQTISGKSTRFDILRRVI